MSHTDIVSTGWIRRLPAFARPYALLARLDRPIGSWLLFLPGAWGILLPAGPTPVERLRLLALFAVGSVVMRSAGCVVNDMWDRDLDRQVARTRGRPLASGALRMRHAATFLALLLCVGLAVLLCLRPLCWELGLLSLVLVALYPLAKRVTWWPQLVMGFTFGFGAPMGYAAATGRIDAAGALLYAGAILWDLGFDTIYGFQDMEDDAIAGIRSTSRLMAAVPRGFVGGCYALAAAALVAAGWAAGLGAWGLLAAVPAAVMLAWQVRVLHPADAPGCLTLFRRNRETGLLIAAAIAAGRFL
ncbi:MAG: 4-hydroxybenzoate octaprenyltransferase [Gluconacetobacter diazotrophicus]|nr:4-hydroxybenzoate octaprenyltransferase [Gluconacetobacter diazotrophicus]